MLTVSLSEIKPILLHPLDLALGGNKTRRAQKIELLSQEEP